MYNDSLFAYFSERRDEIVARISALCAIPSVNAAPLPGKPYGEEVDNVLHAAEALFHSEGFLTEWDAEHRYFLASFGEGEKTIGIFSHADVVPAEDGWVKSPPFSPLYRDGVLSARGAYDNKAGVVAALYMMMAVRDGAVPCSARLVTFVGGGEETSMSDVEAFCRAHPAPDLSLVPDNTFPFSLGEKGRITGYLISPPVLENILDFCGGNAFNVVLDTAKVTIAYKKETLASLSELVADRAEYSLAANEAEGTITLTAYGKSEHAARPAGSQNAATFAARILADLPQLTREERAVFASCDLFLSDPFGGTLGIAAEDAGFGKRTAACGIVRVKNGSLYLSEDIRFAPVLSAEEMTELLLEGAGEEDYVFEVVSVEEGFDLGDDAPCAAAFLDAYRRLTGDEVAVPFRSGGGTYARHLPRAYSFGVMAAVEGCSPREKLAALGYGGAHQGDEGVLVDEYLVAVRVMAEYVRISADVLRNE